MVQLQYTRDLTDKSVLSTTVYYNRLNGEWDLDLESLGAGTDILNYQLSSNFYGGMLNYKLDVNNFRLNVGAHANNYTRTHGMAVLPNNNDLLYTNQGIKPSISGFIKAGVDIGKLNIFADLEMRYTQFKYIGSVSMQPIEWIFFNPKGGLVYNINKNNKLYFSVGKSHREPTRTDMFGGEDDLVTLNTFKAEEVIDYELGVNVKHNKFVFDGNLYYMNFKNEITLLGALGSNGLPLMTNVDKSFRSGIELALSYKLSKSFTTKNTTTASINRIYNTNSDGNKVISSPLYTPWLIVNQELTYKHGRIFITLEGVYNSKSYIDFENKHTTPAFVVLKSTVGYTHNGLTLSVRFNNLTNTKYFTNGYAIDGERYFFVNAPFTAFGNIKLSF